LNSLFEPIIVKGLQLENRIVMPPMYTGLAKIDGMVTKALIEHYTQRARTLGLIIVEHSYVAIEGKLGKRQLGSDRDHLVEGLERLSSSVHRCGVPVVLQINHAGGVADQSITGKQPVGPSEEDDIHELSLNEIEAVVRKFMEAAERAIKAGFDGVEIHGAHGFLLNQFYSPLTNHRTDKYGGSLENRIRFPLDLVRKVRESVKGRLLLYRLGSIDMDPKGTLIENSQEFSKRLAKAGVDILDVSGGICGSRPTKLQSMQGYFVPQAMKIKEVVDIPVIGVGGIKNPEFANQLVLEGKVDLVAVGRRLFEDPLWAENAMRKTGASG
jgi:NADPH2 dehydrogenase